MKWLICLSLLLLCGSGFPDWSKASDVPEPPPAMQAPGLLDNAVKTKFQNLTFWQAQWPEKPFWGDDNPLNLSSDSLESDFRLDLVVQLPHLELMFNPRWDLRWEQWESGRDAGESDTDEEAYVNEWLVRVQPLDTLFLSYGRENLQWGPAMMLSPSNPFFTGNGKNQPKREVPGADYARLVWTPDQSWTASVIVNTDEGRKQIFTDFDKTGAVKIDYLAEQVYGSLILSKREAGDWRLGGFVSWNLDENTIVYVEGSGSDDGVEALTGGSYTFPEGSIVTLEYFYNGYGDRSEDLLALLRAGDWRDTRQLLFRKNYLLLQYYKQDVFGKWSGMLRWTAGLDDNSSALLGLFEYNVMDHLQLFANGTVFRGNNDDELSALLDYQAMIGVEFSF